MRITTPADEVVDARRRPAKATVTVANVGAYRQSPNETLQIRVSDLEASQLLVLREIGRDEVLPGALAKAASLSRTTVTGILDRLETRGFLERRRGDKDKCQILVRATPAGRRRDELAELEGLLPSADGARGAS